MPMRTLAIVYLLFLLGIAAQAQNAVPLTDGVTVMSSGEGGVLRQHTLVVTVVDDAERTVTQSGSVYRSLPDAAETARRQKMEGSRKAIIAALLTLGIKLAPGQEGNTPDFSRTPVEKITFQLPNGPCDGQTLAGHSRRKVLDVIEQAGAKPELLLYSFIIPTDKKAAQQAADADAMKQGIQEASYLAKLGGVQLGKLLAVRRAGLLMVPSPRERLLTRDEVREVGQFRNLVISTLELRFAIR